LRSRRVYEHRRTHARTHARVRACHSQHITHVTNTHAHTLRSKPSASAAWPLAACRSERPQ
jgi:hypothetical protein